MNQIVLNIGSPVVTPEKYAEMTGLSVGSVISKMKLGHLPTLKQGKQRMINLALITREALQGVCAV